MAHYGPEQWLRDPVYALRPVPTCTPATALTLSVTALYAIFSARSL